MTKRIFTRGQTQILYRFLPEAIFTHDDYGLCKVTEVTIEDGGAINQSALFDTLIDTLSQWSREEFRNKFPDPRDKSNLRAYKYGQPREVLFDPFPTILQCKKCKIVVDYSKLKKKGIQPGRCTRSGCGGQFEQLGYVEAHNCGRMKELHLGSPLLGGRSKIAVDLFQSGIAVDVGLSGAEQVEVGSMDDQDPLRFRHRLTSRQRPSADPLGTAVRTPGEWRERADG